MRRKREVSTGKIKKYKARLNLDGSRMKKGIDYQLTYAHVVRWSSIRLTVLLSILNKWKKIKIDYVHAYPQAPIEKEMYMKIPAGVDIIEGEKTDFVLKMLRNIYGQKQAGRVWNKYLHGILLRLGFVQSQVDEGVYSIRLTVLLSILNKWKAIKIDYVHAYPQAPIEKEMYMKIPAGVDIIEGKNLTSF